jgi:uncharacterized protein YndB with AHSA1/START domain
MREVTVHTVISAPREQVFDLVSDLSLRPVFSDHYMREYRLARANPRGVGAAARFKLKLPLASEWAELEIKVCDRPKRIVEEGRIGRLGRSRLVAVYDFIPEAAGTTRVELTTYSEPGNAIEKLKQTGAHGWMKRRSRKALRRLRDLFEAGDLEALAHVRIAGSDPGKAPRFGDHLPAPHVVAGADR